MIMFVRKWLHANINCCLTVANGISNVVLPWNMPQRHGSGKMTKIDLLTRGKTATMWILRSVLWLHKQSWLRLLNHTDDWLSHDGLEKIMYAVDGGGIGKCRFGPSTHLINKIFQKVASLCESFQSDWGQSSEKIWLRRRLAPGCWSNGASLTPTGEPDAALPSALTYPLGDAENLLSVKLSFL